MRSHAAAAPPLAVLVFLSALAVLPINMFVPSLPNIARDLQVEFVVINAAIAGYAVATAGVHLVAGMWSDRWGRRPVAFAALAVFILASVACSLATDVRVFLLCRLSQGAVIAGYVISLAVIRETSAAEGVASRVGYVSSAWAVAPMLGPALGGFIDAQFGWRANFVAFALLGLVGLYLVAFHLRETNACRSAAVASPLRGYAEVLASPSFRAHVLCMALSSGSLYVFLGGAPLVAAQLGEHSSQRLGLYMGLVPAGFMLGSYGVGRMGGRFSATVCMLIGRSLSCLGLLIGLVVLLAGAQHPLAFFGPCVALGLGNGLTLPAAQAHILSLFPARAGTAAGLAAAGAMVGAGGIAFASGALIDAHNASLAVPAIMFGVSLLSLFVALRIAHLPRA